MTGKENIRINKVLKEFNIGMGTLVEFLNKNGIEIESNPGAKLTASQYSIVEKEFRKEQIVKEESKKVAIKVKDITEKEPAATEEEYEPIKEVFIRTNVEEVKRPKILGKMDLNNKNPNNIPEKKDIVPNENKVEIKPKHETQPSQQPTIDSTKKVEKPIDRKSVV